LFREIPARFGPCQAWWNDGRPRLDQREPAGLRPGGVIVECECRAVLADAIADRGKASRLW